jgi:hypothetical protein
MGTKTAFDEFTADVHMLNDNVNGKSHTGTTTFNPVIDRHLRYMADHSNRDIQAGEEILDNYLVFVGDEEDWGPYVTYVRALCSGEDVGIVTSYEANPSAVRSGGRTNDEL